MNIPKVEMDGLKTLLFGKLQKKDITYQATYKNLFVKLGITLTLSGKSSFFDLPHFTSIEVKKKK